jgi:hypothetical protein
MHTQLRRFGGFRGLWIVLAVAVLFSAVAFLFLRATVESFIADAFHYLARLIIDTWNHTA